MAPSDPRRSSRARTIQPQSRPSSTTSSVSGRADRHPKPFVKTGSPQKSISTASLASEPPDDPTPTAEETPPPPTRSRRAAHTSVIKDDDQDRSSIVFTGMDMLNDGDEIQEDDEAVRCICGYEDYPGPPSPDDLKQAAKDGFDVDTVFPTVVTDDLAGFFVQCDICKVWQHGACVGLVNDNTLPEEYYCEECRKDLHKIFPGTNGPRCSIYLVLNRRRSRTGSFVKERERSPKLREISKEASREAGKESKDGSKEPKSSRATSASLTAKRRSTMNSRDAAYDEEQLRIAIEASKGDAGSDNPESTSRRPKRNRSDSEEKTDSIKRQRTSSRSLSPAPEKLTPTDDSDEAMATRNGSSKKSSRTAAAARSQQQREKAEREEKERQRTEAANKRNGRAERRRADGTDMARKLRVEEAEAYSETDSDPSEEVPLAARAATRAAATPTTTSVPKDTPTTETTPTATSAPTAASTTDRTGPARPSQPSPETPPPTTAPAMSASKSKGGRPTHKKKGRNQYTKEREAREEQNSRARSRDVTENGTSKSSGGHGKSRTKGGMGSRITMTEMRRRVAGMSDYISITQVELAGEDKSSSGENTQTKGNTPNGDAVSVTNGDTEGGSPAKKASDNGGPTNLDREFKTLSVVEMMDFINREIVHWQNEYGN